VNFSLLDDMFDGERFVRGVARKGRQIKVAHALVVGSGVVGSAITASLAAAGASTLGLFDVASAAAHSLEFFGFRTATPEELRRCSKLQY
jgi:shikimate dehydrogenase